MSPPPPRINNCKSTVVSLLRHVAAVMALVSILLSLICITDVSAIPVKSRGVGVMLKQPSTRPASVSSSSASSSNPNDDVILSSRQRTRLQRRSMLPLTALQAVSDPDLETAAAAHASTSITTSTSTSMDATTTTTTTKSKSRSVVALFALSATGLVTFLAKCGVLPGPVLADGTGYDVYTNGMIARDLGATVLCATLAYGVVKSIVWAATPTEERPVAYLQPRDSRKLIHTLSAPLFMLVWPLFSSAAGARWFAVIVPLLNAVRLWLAGAGSDNEEVSLAAAVSRSGDRKEAVGGPLIYVGILSAAIVLFWRDVPAGMVALSTMAAGDGMADIIGRRFGKSNPWPVALTGSTNRKSIAGSAALVVCSVVTSAALLWWMQLTGCLMTELPVWPEVFWRLFIIGSVAGFLELIPMADDNYTVPMSAALLALLFF